MKLNNLDVEFIVIGENVHTTRIVQRRGKRVVTSASGDEAVVYTKADGERHLLPIPEGVKRTQDYDEGRIKHVKIAVQAAMSDNRDDAEIGLDYIQRLVQRQEEAGADFLDLNVDEISLKPAQQREAMAWLVKAVGGLTDLPLSVDSSNVEVIQTGLEALGERGSARPMLNSASLERIDALALAAQHGARVVVTAAGETGMPEGTEERVANASRMVKAALDMGIPVGDIFIDPLVFPISVDKVFGLHCLDAIRELRQRFGADIHITGGMSNVSFGVPARKMINDVFVILAVEAGADSGIVDPVSSGLNEVFSLDRDSLPYRLAEDVLLGKDEHCVKYLRAWRKGELGNIGLPPRVKKRRRK